MNANPCNKVNPSVHSDMIVLQWMVMVRQNW